jgi:predicted nuclease of predicted toxin-antitoxin system
MQLLLDAHLPAALALQLQAQDIDAVTISNWQGGAYRTATDEQILVQAALDRRVLVTYDCRTIPMVLKQWAETDQHHAGVLLVDERTIRPSDVGRLLRALQALVAARDNDDWTDRVLFLQAVYQ